MTVEIDDDIRTTLWLDNVNWELRSWETIDNLKHWITVHSDAHTTQKLCLMLDFVKKLSKIKDLLLGRTVPRTWRLKVFWTGYYYKTPQIMAENEKKIGPLELTSFVKDSKEESIFIVKKIHLSEFKEDHTEPKKILKEVK